MNVKTPVIVGYDAVSPLGITLEKQWRGALNGESGIGRLTRFPVSEDFPVKVAGQLPDIDSLEYSFLKPGEQARWFSPLFKYALLTVQRALDNSGIDITPEIAPRVAITYSSAIGGIDAMLAADRKLMQAGKLPHPFTTPNSCINMVGGKISILTRATGPIVATITACATGVSSMIMGAMLLQQGSADLVICGAVDVPLVESIVAGFATMNGAYFPKQGHEDEPPRRASRPFSVDRRGFVVSEGAGAILLCTKEFAKTHGLRYGIAISGWGMTSDAHHFVAPHFPTVRQCIVQSIESAGIMPSDIAAVNAHAASTKVGDGVEYDALKAVFGEKIPPVTANKSLIGHAMGASSAIESIFTVMGMESGKLPPTINYTPDPEMVLDCVPEGMRMLEQEYVLKNAFGFGGCNACIVFRRVSC